MRRHRHGACASSRAALRHPPEKFQSQRQFLQRTPLGILIVFATTIAAQSARCSSEQRIVSGLVREGGFHFVRVPDWAPTRVADPVCENRRRVLVPLGKNSPILVPIRQANVRRKAALGGIFAWAPIPGPHLLQATAGLFAPEYALPQARPTSEVLLERSL